MALDQATMMQTRGQVELGEPTSKIQILFSTDSAL